VTDNLPSGLPEETPNVWLHGFNAEHVHSYRARQIAIAKHRDSSCVREGSRSKAKPERR
jgi:hypothetical protein